MADLPEISRQAILEAFDEDRDMEFLDTYRAARLRLNFAWRQLGHAMFPWMIEDPNQEI